MAFYTLENTTSLGKTKSVSYRLVIYLLSFLQIFYALPLEAMEAMVKERSIWVSSQNLQCEAPGFSTLQVNPNKDGAYALSLSPDLWASLETILLLDGKEPIGLIKSEEGKLKVIGGNFPLVLEGRISSQPEQGPSSGFMEKSAALTYGALSVISQGSLKIIGGIFSQGGRFDAQELSLEGDIESYLPWQGWSHQGDVSLAGNFRGTSDLLLKGKTLKNTQSTWAHSILLDFENGVNGLTGDLKAEQDIILGTSLFEAGPEEGNTFDSFINEGVLRAKRMVQLKGTRFEGKSTSRIFAGVLHHFQGKRYLNSGKLYTPHISLIQSSGIIFGEGFSSESDRFYAMATHGLTLQGTAGRSCAQINAASKILLDSQATLCSKGSLILRQISESQMPYYQYEVGAGLTNTEIELTKQRYAANQSYFFPAEITQYKKTLDLSNLSRGRGVFLSAPYLQQKGRIDSYTGEMRYQGNNILISGSTSLVDHFLQNKLEIQGMNARLEGTLRGAYQTSFNLQNHLYLGGETHTHILNAQSDTTILAGSLLVNRVEIETTSTFTQEKTNFLKAQNVLIKSRGELKADGVNDVDHTLFLQAPHIEHEAWTQSLSLYLMGHDVGISGKVLVQLIQSHAKNTLSHRAGTSAREAQFMGDTIELNQVLNTETLTANATNFLKTHADIKHAKSVNLHGRNSIDVGGNFQECGSTHISTQGMGDISAAIQSNFLKVQGADLHMHGQNEISEVLRAAAKRNLTNTSKDFAPILHYTSGNDLKLGGEKDGTHLSAVAQGNVTSTANIFLNENAQFKGDQSANIGGTIKILGDISLESKGSVSSTATIESQNLGIRGYEGYLSGHNKVTSNLYVDVRSDLMSDGRDTAERIHYLAGNNMCLKGEKTSLTLTAVAEHLDSTANITTIQSTYLRGTQSASVAGNHTSKGDVSITSEGPTLVPANIKSQNLGVQGSDVGMSGDKDIAEVLRVTAAKNLESMGNERASQLQYTSIKDMKLSGKKEGVNLTAFALGNLQSESDIHTTKTTFLESGLSSHISGKINSGENVHLSAKSQQSASPSVTTNILTTKGEKVDLAWDAQAEKVAVVANKDLSHSGNTTSDNIYFKSKAGQLEGNITSDHEVTLEIDELSTNWKALLNKLSVSGNNLTLGGDITAGEVFLAILDKLYIKDVASIQALQVHAKTFLKEGNLKGRKALLDIEETATLQGNSHIQESFHIRVGKLILQQAHLISDVFDLVAKDISTSESSLKTKTTLIEGRGGMADLRGVAINSSTLFSLKADEAELTPSLITSELSDISLKHYKDGMKGVIKIAHDLVNCKSVRFDARDETLTIDQPTQWRPNIYLAVKEAHLNESLSSTGTIGIESETGIDIKKSIDAENLYLRAKRKDLNCNKALLKAIQSVALQADEGSINGIGSKILAEQGDLVLQAALDLTLESIKQRTGSEENYHEEKIETQAKAGGKLKILVGRDINFTGVKTYAGKDTHLEAGRHIIDRSLAREFQTVSRYKKNFKRDKYVHQDVSVHHTEGGFKSQAGGNQELYAPKVKAKGITIAAKGDVNIHETHDSHEHESESYKRGWFGSSKTIKEKSFSARSKGAEFTSDNPAEIISGSDLSLTNIAAQAPKIILSAEGNIQILLGTNYYSASKNESSSNIIWQKQSSRVEEHKTFTPSSFTGKIEIHSKETLLQSVKNQTLDFLNQIEQKDGKIKPVIKEEFHYIDEKTVQGPSKALAAVVALAVTICTAGTGAKLGAMSAASLHTIGTTATVISGMTAAGFTSICSQAALALLNSQGDPGKAAKILASKDTLKSLCFSMAGAGLTAGIGHHLGMETNASELAKITQGNIGKGFVAHLKANLLKGAVSGGVSIAAGENPQDVLLQTIRGTVANVIGGVAANKIGQIYGTAGMDPLSHKFWHSLVGGVTGAMVADNPIQGATAGAMGAFIAETFADMFTPDKPQKSFLKTVERAEKEKGRNLTFPEIESLYNRQMEEYSKQVDQIGEWSKLTAATSLLLTGQDVSTGIFTATNAIDNNFLMLAYYGVVAASIGYSGYEIYKAYRDEGPLGALKQLGIEITIDLVGGMIIKGAGAAGRIFYPSIKEAVTIILNNNPGLKTVLGGVADKIISGAEALCATQGGKLVLKTEQKIKGMHDTLKNNIPLSGKPYKPVDTASFSRYLKPEVKSVNNGKNAPLLREAKNSRSPGEAGEYKKYLKELEEQSSVPQELRPDSAVNRYLLRNQLIGEQISTGHAFEKHIVQQGEFSGLMTDKKQLGQHVENILRNENTKVYRVREGANAYVHEKTHTVIIHNSKAPDGGTVFQPEKTMKEFLEERRWEQK